LKTKRVIAPPRSRPGRRRVSPRRWRPSEYWTNFSNDLLRRGHMHIVLFRDRRRAVSRQNLSMPAIAQRVVLCGPSSRTRRLEFRLPDRILVRVLHRDYMARLAPARKDVLALPQLCRLWRTSAARGVKGTLRGAVIFPSASANRMACAESAKARCVPSVSCSCVQFRTAPSDFLVSAISL